MEKGKKILFFLAAFFGLIAFVIWKEGLVDFYTQLRSVKYNYILIGALLMVLGTTFDSFSMHSIRLNYQSTGTIFTSLKCIYSSFALGLLTPFQSGYLAGAIAYLNKYKMTVADASTVMLVKTINFIIIQQLFVFFMIVTQHARFDLPFIIWFLLGLSIFITCSYLFLLVIISKAENLLRKIFSFLFRLLTKLHIIKPEKNLEEKAFIEIKKLKENMENINITPLSELKSLFFSCCQVFCIYSLPWWVYRGVSLNEGLGVFQVVSGQAFCNVIQQIFPIPGGIGITEIMYTNIMNPIMGSDRLNLAMLLWRMIATYLPIIIGLAVILFGQDKKYDIIKERIVLH